MKRVYLWENGSSVISEDILRAAAVAIAENATNDKTGRNLGDPVFDMVTQGRAGAKGYSSCGDLCHYVLFCLGCRNFNLVNRTAKDYQWKPQINISRLVFKSGNAWTPYSPGLLCKPGDIGWVSLPDQTSTEHVFVVKEHTDTYMDSYDYGQWFNSAPGGIEKNKKVEIQGNKMLVSGRYLNGWIDISKVEFAESAIVPDDFALGILDENPYEETGVKF